MKTKGYITSREDALGTSVSIEQRRVRVIRKVHYGTVSVVIVIDMEEEKDWMDKLLDEVFDEASEAAIQFGKTEAGEDDIEVIDIVDNDNNHEVIEIADDDDDDDEDDEMMEIEDEGPHFEDILDIDSDEEEEEEHDSAYSSDDEVIEETVERVVPQEQLVQLNENTRYCVLTFYYSTGGALSVCAACMPELADVYLGQMQKMRKHATCRLNEMDLRFCSNCRNPVYTIITRDMCFKCMQ